MNATASQKTLIIAIFAQASLPALTANFAKQTSTSKIASVVAI